MVDLTDDDRRRRLAVRHGLARRLDTVAAATRAMTVLHATEAATVHLALWARVDGVTVDDVDRALYDDRSIVKQLAMRRTLFAFPRDLLPAAWGSAARRVAGQQRTLMVKDLVALGIDDPDAWLASAEAEVLALLGDGTARTTAEVRERVSALAGTVQRGAPGSRWAAEVPLAPRVMTLLGARGLIVLFDSNGNAGNTAWWDGRIVGCWVQDDAARVHLVLRDDLPTAGRRALDAEAERLTTWLDGVRITNVYASPQMRGARLP